jgi:glycosyltransferase involved in cell wall biosynthesis
MPRIAYLYSRYPVVSQTFCDSEMLALEASGFDLEIVSLNAPPDSFRHERLDRLRAEIHYPPPEKLLAMETGDVHFREKLGPLIAAHDQKYGASFKATTRARNAWHFSPLLKKLGVSHVHVHFANRATHTALFLKQLGFTFSFTAHAQDFMVDLGNDDLLLEMVHEAEFVVAVSDFSKGLLAGISPADESKLVRIYNGIELDDFPVAHPEQAAPLRMVSIGRLIEFKGFQHLIAAVQLLKQQGVDVSARIIGEGPMRGVLEKQIGQLGLAENIHLLGVRSQEQIKAELAAAHVFVLPSIVDPKGASDILPTVITEAMACSLPVVSTRVAGIPEMVQQEQTGLLVEPKDDAGLASAIARLAREPDTRKRMGQAGRIHAKSLFALENTAAQLGRLFRDSLSIKTTAARTESPVLYYLNSPGEEAFPEAFAAEPRLRILVARANSPAHETLPDACVLESLWLRRASLRQQMEKLRATIGDAFDGESFYIQARRALWMAEALPKRGTKHVHACRSDAMICVWLLKKISSLSVSVAVEESPDLSRALIARLLPDFDLSSVSDEKLLSPSTATLKDWLHLKKPASHRKLRLGPLQVKVRSTPPAQDRELLERTWFEHLLQHLHG